MWYTCALMAASVIYTLGKPYRKDDFSTYDDLSDLQLLLPLQYVHPARDSVASERFALLDGPYSHIPAEEFVLDDPYYRSDDTPKSKPQHLTHPQPSDAQLVSRTDLLESCLTFMYDFHAPELLFIQNSPDIIDSDLILYLCKKFTNRVAAKKVNRALYTVEGNLGMDRAGGEASNVGFGGQGDAAGHLAKDGRDGLAGNLGGNTLDDFISGIAGGLLKGLTSGASNGGADMLGGGGEGYGGIAGNAGLYGNGGMAGNAGFQGQGGVAGNAGVYGKGRVAGNLGVAGVGGQAGNLGVGGTGGLFGNLGIGGQGGLFGNLGVGGISGNQNHDRYHPNRGQFLNTMPGVAPNKMASSNKIVANQHVSLAHATEHDGRDVNLLLNQRPNSYGLNQASNLPMDGPYKVSVSLLDEKAGSGVAGGDVQVGFGNTQSTVTKLGLTGNGKLSTRHRPNEPCQVGALAYGGVGGQVGNLAVSGASKVPKAERCDNCVHVVVMSHSHAGGEGHSSGTPVQSPSKKPARSSPDTPASSPSETHDLPPSATDGAESPPAQTPVEEAPGALQWFRPPGGRRAPNWIGEEKLRLKKPKEKNKRLFRSQHPKKKFWFKSQL